MLVERPKDYKFYQYRLMGDKVVEYKQIVAHHFEVADEQHQSDAFDRLVNWAASDCGKWIMKNASEDPYYDWYRHTDTYTTEFKIIATFELKKLSEYYLRWK